MTPPICDYRFPDTGALCGYQGQGQNRKAQLIDLFRHQQQHVNEAKARTMTGVDLDLSDTPPRR